MSKTAYALDDPSTHEFVTEAVSLVAAHPDEQDVHRLAHDLKIEHGWVRLDEAGWMEVFKEIVRRVRNEPWRDGEELVVVSVDPADGCWHGFNVGDRVMVLHQETFPINNKRAYLVERFSDNGVQALCEPQLDFPFDKWVD